MTSPVRGPVTMAPRRSQAQRASDTRRQLVDAAIDGLAEQGWAAMSTNDVVRRARVSRGALAHHFPTKAALMLAAAERLVERRMTEFEQAFSALPAEQRSVDGALDLLWSYFSGPTFGALLELSVAARTNPDLRDVLADGPERINAAALDVFVHLFPAVGDSPHGQDMLRATFALLSGLAVQAIVDGDRHGHHRDLVTKIKAIGTALVPAPGAPTRRPGTAERPR